MTRHVGFWSRQGYNSQENLYKYSTTKVCHDSTIEHIRKAGKQVCVQLYGGLHDVETLDMLRYGILTSKVCVGNIFVQVQTLPLTSDAA